MLKNEDLWGTFQEIPDLWPSQEKGSLERMEGRQIGSGEREKLGGEEEQGWGGCRMDWIW